MSDAPFSFQQLDHLVLRTENLPRLRDFYLQLGCTVERDLVADMGMVQLRLGGSMLDIVDVAGDLGGSGEAPHETQRNLDHYAVRIEPFDRDAILSFCTAHDIPAQPMKRLFGADGYGPAVYITDPDGNRMELKGPPEA